MTTAKPSAKAYWLGQALGWGLFLAVNLAYVLPYKQDRGTICIQIWVALTGLAFTHFWHGWIRGHGWMQAGHPANLPKLAAGAIAVGLLQTASGVLSYAVFRPPGTDFHTIGWLPAAVLFWIVVCSVWTALYGLGQALRRARQAELDRLGADIAAKEAALQALKAQTNPHFFFNSLNSVRALVFIDAEAAARMIDQIAALMRYALESLDSDTVPLAEELKVVRTYLAIEKTRYEDRLQVEEQLEPGLENWPVPPMALQTLVENAVKYGTTATAGPTQLRLTLRRHEKRLLAEVANSGHLASESLSTGLGLANLRQRLALLYGGSAEFALGEGEGWVSATLLLPEIVA